MGHGPDWSGSQYGEVADYFECGNSPSGVRGGAVG
jgi:hypothetical protein